MIFRGRQATTEGEIRHLECECGNHQVDSTTRHVQEIRCLSCGRAGIEHDKPKLDTRSAEFDYLKYNGVDAPKDYV